MLLDLLKTDYRPLSLDGFKICNSRAGRLQWKYQTNINK